MLFLLFVVSGPRGPIRINTEMVLNYLLFAVSNQVLGQGNDRTLLHGGIPYTVGQCKLVTHSLRNVLIYPNRIRRTHVLFKAKQSNFTYNIYRTLIYTASTISKNIASVMIYSKLCLHSSSNGTMLTGRSVAFFCEESFSP